MKKKPKKGQGESVVVACSKCGHPHSFASLDALEVMPLSTPCAGCGFLYLQWLASKMDAALTLLQSDAKALALMQDGKIKDFAKYLQKKTGM